MVRSVRTACDSQFMNNKLIIYPNVKRNYECMRCVLRFKMKLEHISKREIYIWFGSNVSGLVTNLSSDPLEL